MAFSTSLPFPILAVALMTIATIFPAQGQVSSPCSASMLTSFTPCMNFFTNSSSNGTSPTTDCCNSLKSFTNGGMGCLCLIVSGNVPFQVPINQTLAISLPRACNMAGVPVQCKASVAPVPAPGPISLSPVASPGGSVVPTESTPSAASPESDTTPSTEAAAPTATTGSRTVLTPSAAVSSYNLSPSLLLHAVGFVVLKYHY